MVKWKFRNEPTRAFRDTTKAQLNVAVAHSGVAMFYNCPLWRRAGNAGCAPRLTNLGLYKNEAGSFRDAPPCFARSAVAATMLGAVSWLCPSGAFGSDWFGGVNEDEDVL
jgi:hypothetical protein